MNSTLDGRPLFTIKHTSRITRIHRQTLKKAVELGAVDSVHVGARRLIPRAEVLRLMRQAEEK
jgi:excisionase family DNA binding protein